MNAPSLETEFQSFARDPASAVEGALIVSRIVRPDTDAAWCRGELRRLAAIAGVDAGPIGLVDALRAAGFAGAGQYYAIENSSLEYVLRARRGIPITLAMVLVGAGECLGMAATGINFPGHFMASLNGQLVDPYSMTAIDESRRREWLKRSNLTEVQAFRPATPADVVVRMLNNLRMLAVSRGDHAGALELTGYQLVVAPDAFTVRIDRAELWLAIGATDMARRDLEDALTLAPDDEIRIKIEDKLGQLAAARPTLH